jgi:branched-chain amino acid aminotransferase
MSPIIFNHQILRKEEFKISIANRAFLYGDGLFESVKIINGQAFNLDTHLKRLFSASLLLHLEINISRNDFQDDIELLIRENRIKKGGNLKILVFREGGGKYLPQNNNASCLIMSENSDKNLFCLNKKGLELGLYKTQLKPMNKLSNYKTISALQSIMCSLDAKQKGKDDCLMFNTENRIIESANSNIFYVKNNIIFTPKLREGCVDGTMRNCILSLKDLDYKIVENEVKLGNILEAEEVFLTNAIQGVRWVSHIKEQQFTEKKVAKLLTSKINQLV